MPVYEYDHVAKKCGENRIWEMNKPETRPKPRAKTRD